MIKLTPTPELLKLARRVIWFEPPKVALTDPVRFMAYAMRYATAEDMGVLLRRIGEDGLREALDRAPAGIIDPRSWAYWNVMIGRYPAPPMPMRTVMRPASRSLDRRSRRRSRA